MVLKIKKVNEIIDEGVGMHGLEVVLDDDGDERIECFDGADWLEKDEDGEEKFVKKLRQNKQKAELVKAEPEKHLPKPKQVKEKTAFKNKVISLEGE